MSLDLVFIPAGAHEAGLRPAILHFPWGRWSTHTPEERGRGDPFQGRNCFSLVGKQVCARFSACGENRDSFQCTFIEPYTAGLSKTPPQCSCKPAVSGGGGCGKNRNRCRLNERRLASVVANSVGNGCQGFSHGSEQDGGKDWFWAVSTGGAELLGSSENKSAESRDHTVPCYCLAI